MTKYCTVKHDESGRIFAVSSFLIHNKFLIYLVEIKRLVLKWILPRLAPCLFCVLWFVPISSLGAQDLHFSQFYYNPLQYNPANTGNFRGDLRAGALYRSQWRSVPVSYQTLSAACDLKILRSDRYALLGGILLEHDQAGDGNLTWTQVGLSMAASHAIGERQALAVGFGINFAQRAVDLSNLNFRNQWAGDVFNPALPSKESFNPSTGVAPTLSGGINWHFEPSGDRTSLDAGIGAFHFNQPLFDFAQVKTHRLPMRITAQVNATYQTNETTDLLAFVMGQQMARARSLTFGGGFRRILSEGVANHSAIQFSLATRLGDAVIPAVAYERNNWTAGISYDINISPFSNATAYRGGFELALIYRVIPAPPAKAVKSCPIF